jgi:hypothetical protein
MLPSHGCPNHVRPGGVEGEEIPGVVHTIGAAASLEEFDERERGYRRVRVPPDALSFADAPEAEARVLTRDVEAGKCVVYMYIPLEASAGTPTEDFPICQTYLDTVMEGCIEMGGEAMAEQFVTTTSGWSDFFLDDTPTSRRPWLNRKHYVLVDAILERHAAHTRMHNRKHPEEFATEHLTALRGLWGAPVRNSRFCGRARELERLAEAMADSGRKGKDSGVGAETGITRLHVIGLGCVLLISVLLLFLLSCHTPS